MGRTIPSFRIALGMEKEEWKPFRNALDKKDRKKFDDMFDVLRSYISACSNSVRPVSIVRSAAMMVVEKLHLSLSL
jgi:hypothetical protein